MERAVLQEALDVAERHVAEGERHIRRQQEIVARLSHLGRRTSPTAGLARDLLYSMQRVQRAHLSHRDLLKAELARLDAAERSAEEEALGWSAAEASAASTGSSGGSSDGMDPR